MKTWKILFSPVVSLALLVGFAPLGCEPTTRKSKFYAITSVPEEAGIKLKKVTDTEDNIPWPDIQERGDMLIYNARALYDISKDEKKVAFLSLKNNKVNIYIRDLTGGKTRLQRTFRDNVLDVAFSPDGKRLAFSDFRGDSTNIYTIDAAAGSAIRQITTSNTNELFPACHPDGRTLVFVRVEVEDQARVKVLERRTHQETGYGSKAGGSGSSHSYYYYQFKADIAQTFLWTFDLERGFLIQHAKGSCPSFCPDGKDLYVTRIDNENGLSEIWRIGMENGQEFLIKDSEERGFTAPTVSPDGKKIAFVTNTKGKDVDLNLDIYLMNVDGTGLTQLTFHPGHDVLPRWGKDGKSIYFLSQRGSKQGEWNIWQMQYTE